MYVGECVVGTIEKMVDMIVSKAGLRQMKKARRRRINLG